MSVPRDGAPTAPGERRCPRCGALVSADAEWCGQCYANLLAPAAAQAALAEDAQGAADTATPPDVSASSAPSPYWSCPVCGEHNALDLETCPVCRTPFAKLFDEAPPRRDVSRSRAVTWSLAYPGLGHRLVGRTGEGLSRAAVFTLAVGAILFLAIARAGNSLGPILGFLAVYAAFAVAVYAFTAVEAGHLADGGDPLVSPRAFAWVAAGLVVVSLGVSVFIAVGATRGR
jgi:hypothetical protein